MQETGILLSEGVYITPSDYIVYFPYPSFSFGGLTLNKEKVIFKALSLYGKEWAQEQIAILKAIKK